MTRTEVVAQYRVIRAGIRRVLRLAPNACNRADLTRAIKHIAPWADKWELGKDTTAEMVVDVALFEPNQHGRRAYDRFLEQQASKLNAADRALAVSMAGAWFSIFRVAERHETAGTWLEDLLNGNRRLWMMDESLEGAATEGQIIGMRLFDAGLFHAGFGIVVTPDEETTYFAVNARARGNRLPFRHSLSATLYGDQLRAERRFDSRDILQIEIPVGTLSGRNLLHAETMPARQRRPHQRVRSSKPT